MFGYSEKYAIFVVLLILKLNITNVNLEKKFDPRTFVVSLHDLQTRKHFCTGTIVAARWVLTSATCLIKKKPRHIKIVGGTTYLKSRGNGYAVDSFVVDPYFNKDKLLGNLALVKTRRKFRVHKGLRWAQMANITKEGVAASVIGWNNGSAALDVGQVSVANFSSCLRGKNEKTGPELACIETKTSLDEGAPLVLNDKLVGVFSYETKKCKKENFYWFTKVLYFQDWLFDLIYYCGC